MYRCENCGSENIKPVKIPFKYLGKLVKGVPVIRCQECGEEMMDSDVMDRVDQLVKEGKHFMTNQSG